MKRILVIDDDQEDCAIFEEAVQQTSNPGLVTCVPDLTGLTFIINEFKPDLLFTELNLRMIDNLDFIHEIKDNHPLLPIIIYSDSTFRKKIDEAYDQGATLLFNKPNNFRQLISGLQLLLDMDWQNHEALREQSFGKIFDSTKPAH